MVIQPVAMGKLNADLKCYNQPHPTSTTRVPTFLLLNPTSLVKAGAIEQLLADVSSYNGDIVGICETWFKTNQPDSLFTLPGYTLHRQDRAGRPGGGLCIFVRQSISSFTVTLPSSSSNCGIETMCVHCVFNRTDFIVYLCYHAPRPVYRHDSLINYIISDFDFLYNSYPCAAFLCAGDFNSLNCDFMSLELGLEQVNFSPTHGPNVLDKIFCSFCDIYSSYVVKAAVKTKHLLVICTDANIVDRPPLCNDSPSVKRRIPVYDLREPYVINLRYRINQQLNSLHVGNNALTPLYNDLVSIAREAVYSTIPVKYVTLRRNDPPFMSPLIKSLLRQRYNLRRTGRVRMADLLTVKINALIKQNTSQQLSNVRGLSVKKMWNAVKPCLATVSAKCSNLDPEAFNCFFSSISFNHSQPDDYSHLAKIDSSNLLPPVTVDLQNFNLETVLKFLKNTSPGYDQIPAWFYRLCSVELSTFIANLLNESFNTSSIPNEWRTAVVTPVPKIPKPQSPADYRPISVTPILSRLAESVIVRNYLSPVLHCSLGDQFAFRPTGSTTCALISIVHTVTKMLEKHNYVRCLLIDFSKAFDTVNRSIMLRKLAQLPLPRNIYAWICSFLSSRVQVTKVEGLISGLKSVNLGVVQGSVLGPSLFSVMISDLTPSCDDNEICKYADDVTLLVPELSGCDLATEFTAIQQWSLVNALTINIGKTKELVFRRPNMKHDISPDPIAGILQVSEAKLLGVIFTCNLKFSAHVTSIVSASAKNMFLLRNLKNRGLGIDHLQIIFHALILSRILYCVQVWGGLLTKHDIGSLDKVLLKCYRFLYTKSVLCFTELLTKADLKLFKKMQNTNHCLNHLLPPVNQQAITLRPRGHPYVIPAFSSTLHKRSFVNRILFKFVKC